MKKLLFLLIIGMFTLPSLTNAQKLKIAVGIKVKSTNKVRRLKTHDRIRTDEKLQIYLKPYQKSYCYVVFNDNGKEATQLNQKVLIPGDSLIILPSKHEYFQFDEKTKKAVFTIICCKKKNKEVEEYFNNKKKKPWNKFVNKLKARYQKSIGGITEKPFTMAGNVRAAKVDFTRKLRLFTGNELIIKNYEITIKK